MRSRKVLENWPQAGQYDQSEPGFSEGVSHRHAFAPQTSRTDDDWPTGELTRELDTDAWQPRTAFPGEGPQGHRERMRDRLLDRGPEGLADYEILEMLLFLVQQRGDTKPLAKRLINQFGSYGNVLSASIANLLEVPGVGRHTVAALKLMAEGAVRLAREELRSQPILSNSEQLLPYLFSVMAREKIEQFRILFLDIKNRLIVDELQGRGTINHTPVYVREVAKRALELHAAGIILTHNHPSGDPTPSIADLDMTRHIETALKALGISVYDHVIIGNGKSISLRKEGFL